MDNPSYEDFGKGIIARFNKLTKEKEQLEKEVEVWKTLAGENVKKHAKLLGGFLIKAAKLTATAATYPVTGFINLFLGKEDKPKKKIDYISYSVLTALWGATVGLAYGGGPTLMKDIKASEAIQQNNRFDQAMHTAHEYGEIPDGYIWKDPKTTSAYAFVEDAPERQIFGHLYNSDMRSFEPRSCEIHLVRAFEANQQGEISYKTKNAKPSSDFMAIIQTNCREATQEEIVEDAQRSKAQHVSSRQPSLY